MISSVYTRDFQIHLLFTLYKDVKFIAETGRWFKLTDFDIPSIRLLFEIMYKYFIRYQQRIPFEVLRMEAITAVKFPMTSYDTVIEDIERPMLSAVLHMLVQSMTQPASVDYFRGELVGYLKHVRVSQVQSAGMLTADQQIEHMMLIDKELKTLGTTEMEFGSAFDEVDEEESVSGRIGTGIPHIDLLTNNGLLRKQLGLLVACTGVGKTTGMLNFAVNAAIQNLGSLTITLELPGAQIKQRASSVMAMVDAHLFNIRREQWPVGVRERMRYVNSPEFPYSNHVRIYDASGGGKTLRDIDEIIAKWKELLRNQGYPDDFGAVVYVDWLERINTDGVVGMTRNMTDSKILRMLLEQLNDIGKKHNVLMWTATQGNSEGQTKEVLRIQHTSNSRQVHHPCDLSLGMAPLKLPDKGADTGYIPSDDVWASTTKSVSPPCDRTLNISFMKTRYSALADHYTSVYQGPTLKMWTKKSVYERSRKIVEEEGLLESYGALG